MEVMFVQRKRDYVSREAKALIGTTARTLFPSLTFTHALTLSLILTLPWLFLATHMNHLSPVLICNLM